MWLHTVSAVTSRPTKRSQNRIASLRRTILMKCSGQLSASSAPSTGTMFGTLPPAAVGEPALLLTFGSV